MAVPERRYRAVSKKHQAAFLQHLEQGMTVKRAAEATGHTPSAFHKLAQRDPEFAAAKHRAFEIGTDVLEEEARRRAVEGWDEPLIGKVERGIDGQLRDADGKPMFVRRYSDRLLEVLLKGRRPDYRESHRVDIRNQTLIASVPDRSAALHEVAAVLREVGAVADVLQPGDVKALPADGGVVGARSQVAESLRRAGARPFEIDGQVIEESDGPA